MSALRPVGGISLGGHRANRTLPHVCQTFRFESRPTVRSQNITGGTDAGCPNGARAANTDRTTRSASGANHAATGAEAMAALFWTALAIVGIRTCIGATNACCTADTAIASSHSAAPGTNTFSRTMCPC